MKHPEHDIQKALIRWRDLQSCKYPELRWMHAIPNGGQRNPIVAAKLKAEGVTSGVFDLFLPVARHGYHGLYLELKAGKGRLSGNQVAFEDFLIAQGYMAVTCWTLEAAIEAITEYLS